MFIKPNVTQILYHEFFVRFIIVLIVKKMVYCILHLLLRHSSRLSWCHFCTVFSTQTIFDGNDVAVDNVKHQQFYKWPRVMIAERIILWTTMRSVWFFFIAFFFFFYRKKMGSEMCWMNIFFSCGRLQYIMFFYGKVKCLRQNHNEVDT